MKQLKDVVENIPVNESFKSRELGGILKGNPGMKLGNLGAWSYELQWDKISDSDFNKIYSVDEALRIMRSRRNGAHYLLWITKKSNYYSYHYENYSELFVYAITVGTDVEFWDGHWRERPDSTRGCVTSHTFNLAIEILDWEKFMSKDLKKQRREAKEGALALQDAQTIAATNMKRYKETLQDMRNKKEFLSVQSLFEDAMDAYKETSNIWLDLYIEYAQTGNASYYKVAENWHKMNQAIDGLIKNMRSVINYSNNSFWVDMVNRDIKQIKQSAQIIQDLAQKARDAQK